RRRRERVIRLVRTGRHVVDALFDDAKALTHFFNSDDGAVIAVAMYTRRDIEVKMFVAGIWLLLPEIPLHAAGSKIWAGCPPLDRLFDSECANADGARLKNAIPENRTVVFREARGQIFNECEDQVVPTLRKILRNAADAKPVRMHPRAADCFDDFERTLAVVERVEDGRHLSDVLCEGAVPDQMADDSKQLCEHHAYDLCARRHKDTAQLLYGHEVGEIIHHATQVIDAIGVRDIGMPALAFPHFLRAAMVKSYLWYGIDNLFAVELEHDAQHPVSSGMLGTDVQEHQVGILTYTLHPEILGLKLQRLLRPSFRFWHY